MAEQDNVETEALSPGDGHAAEPGAADNAPARDPNNPVWDEHIDIDFFLNVELSDQNEEKLRTVFQQTCEVTAEQVTEITTTVNSNHRTRITLKILTDEWEMPLVSKKVTNLIPEGTLSQSLLETLELEKRPRVGQFFSKSSTGAIPRIDQPDKYPYDSEERRASSRESLAKSKENEDAQAAQSTNSSAQEEAPSNQGCGCNIL